MRYLLIMLCGLTACGVNPERAADMHGRTKSNTNATTELPKLTADDSDPKEIRNAIAALDATKQAVEQKDWVEYHTRRYEVARPIIYNANEAIATNSKTPQIIQKLQMIDGMAAQKIGTDASALANPARETTASADAIYAFSDGVKLCRDGVANAKSADELANIRGQFEAAVQKAVGFDPRAEQFAGRSPTGAGFIDVPVETAVCRALLNGAEASIADLPAKPVDKSSTYAGCGFFDIALEAKQLPNGGFDAYAVTSFIANDPAPGSAEVVTCDKIPPISDAPNDVQTVLTNQLQWLQPTDIVSMSGSFAYEQRTPTEMVKKGTARVFRRQAQLSTNRCGAKDVNVTCSADGDPLTLKYDHGKHYLNRADAYRAKGDADTCLKMAKEAQNVTGEVPATGDPVKIFQVSDNRRLTFTNIKSEIEAMHTQAAEMANSNWCAKAP